VKSRKDRVKKEEVDSRWLVLIRKGGGIFNLFSKRYTLGGKSSITARKGGRGVETVGTKKKYKRTWKEERTGEEWYEHDPALNPQGRRGFLFLQQGR